MMQYDGILEDDWDNAKVLIVDDNIVSSLALM